MEVRAQTPFSCEDHALSLLEKSLGDHHDDSWEQLQFVYNNIQMQPSKISPPSQLTGSRALARPLPLNLF